MFLVGGIVGACITAMTVGKGENGEGEKPAAAHGEGRENTAAVNAHGNVKPTTSSGAKVMNANLISATLLHVDSPATWEATVSHAQRKQDALAAELINIALDETEPNESRLEAIFQLGRLGNRTALEFLIKNVALHLPLPLHKGDNAQQKEFPCKYTLFHSGNWRVAQLVIESLDVPKSKWERLYLASVLKACLGKNVVKFVLDEHMYRGPNEETDQRNENLKAIRAILFD